MNDLAQQIFETAQTYNQIALLKIQRDELLAALRDIVELQARDYETPEDMLMAQVETARAAIAKVDGK